MTRKHHIEPELKTSEKLSPEDLGSCKSIFLYGTYDKENAMRLMEHFLAVLEGGEPPSRNDTRALFEVLTKAFRLVIHEGKSADFAFGLRQGKGVLADEWKQERDWQIALDVRILRPVDCYPSNPEDLVANKFFGEDKGGKAVEEAVRMYRDVVETTYGLLSDKEKQERVDAYLPVGFNRLNSRI